MNFKWLTIAASAAFLSLAGPASAKETVTFGYLADPSHEAIMWALRNGKVTSDTVEVEATALEIPALIQATAARTYDVIQTAAMAIPRARSRGLNLVIMGAGLRYHESGEGSGIWVAKDSEIQSVEDLKGKRLAVYSLGSSGITLVRIALADVHGLDVSLQGGDLTFVEMPAPGMPAALASGNVDAATLIHAQSFQASQTGDFRPVVQAGRDLTEKFGVRMVSAVIAGYQEKLEESPETYREFQRMLHASMRYAVENPDEVYPAVGQEFDVDPAFFEAWFNKYSEFPVVLAEQDEEAITLLWEKAKELGLLDDYEPIEATVWDNALRADEVE